MQIAYCTAQDVIDRCTWPGFGQLSASAQDGFILTASERVDRVCRRKFGFASQTVVETFGGANQTTLRLSLRPVAAVAAVSIDGEPLDNPDGLAWTFDPDSGELVLGRGRDDIRFGRNWHSGTGNIVVTYSGGYADIPRSIVTATAFYVRYLHDQGKVAGAFAMESLGDYSYKLREQTLVGGVPDHIWGLLADSGFVQDDAFA